MCQCSVEFYIADVFSLHHSFLFDSQYLSFSMTESSKMMFVLITNKGRLFGASIQSDF